MRREVIDYDQGVLRVKGKALDSPDRIQLIAGDLLYCMRSALDQLAWCLAKLTLEYPEHTQFPIFEYKNDERFKRFTRGIPEGAVKIIEDLQPYNRLDPKDALLRHLNLLCNIDKHRRIPVHGDETDFADVFTQRVAPFVRFEGNEFIAPLSMKNEINLDCPAKVKIVFGDSAAQVAVTFSGLERIYEFITSSVIPRFARFFIAP